jgi:general secretion pathway protein E
VTSKDRSDQQVTDAVSWLIANGLLPQEKHARAVAMAQHSSERMDQLLLKLGLVNEQHLAQALSVACDLPLVAREAFPADAPFNGLLQTDYLRAQRIAPLRMADGSVQLVMADPFNAEAIAAVALKTGLRVRPAVGVGGEIDVWLVATAVAPRQERDVSAAETGGADSDLQRLRDLAGGA